MKAVIIQKIRMAGRNYVERMLDRDASLGKHWERTMTYSKTHPMNVVAVLTLVIATWGAYQAFRANHPVARLRIIHAEMAAPGKSRGGTFGGRVIISNEGARPCTVRNIAVAADGMTLETGGTGASEGFYRAVGSGYFECTPLPYSISGYTTQSIFFSGAHRETKPWGQTPSEDPNEVTLIVYSTRRSERVRMIRCKRTWSSESEYFYPSQRN